MPSCEQEFGEVAADAAHSAGCSGHEDRVVVFMFRRHVADLGLRSKDELATRRIAHDALPFPFLASMALMVFAKAFSKTPLPMVPTTNPSSRPLRFLPSRTTTTLTSVVPSGRRVNV